MSSWFANIRYSRKMLMAFGIIILAGLIPFAIGLRSMLAMRDALHATNVEGQEIANLHKAQTDLLKMHLAENAYLVSRASADLGEARRLAGSVIESLRELAEVADSADETEEAGEVGKVVADNHAQFVKFAARTEGKEDPAGMAAMVERQGQDVEKLGTLVEEAREEIEEALRDVGQAADQDAQRTLLFGAGLVAICLLGGIALSLILSRGITRPLLELRAVAEKISTGNADVKITTGRKDEIGQLSDAFDRMVTAVRFLQMEVAEHEAAQKPREMS
jgi:HAMP domain-containing protein